MFVYFIRSIGLDLIKIGRTEDVRLRLAAHSVSNPDRLDLLGVIMDVRSEELEARLHRRFAQARFKGEWFRPTAALLRYIEEHAGQPVEPTVEERAERRLIRLMDRPAGRRTTIATRQLSPPREGVLRYVVRKAGKLFWQPTRQMKSMGLRPKALGPESEASRAEARRLYKAWLEARSAAALRRTARRKKRNGV